MTFKATIRTIGNSKGLIIPKKFLSECGREQEVSLTVKDKILLVKPIKQQKDWSEFKRGKQEIDFVSNNFDHTEWTESPSWRVPTF